MKKYCLDCKKEKSPKGLYCKSCGYNHRTRPSGLKYNIVAVNKSWFKKGDNVGNKFREGAVPWNKGTKGLMLANITSFKKGQEAWNKGLPHMQDGEHPNWKGDEVGYSAIHAWIKRKLGKPSKCEECCTVEATRFEWANISGQYKRDFSDWKRLCSKCHANEHKNWEVRWHVV